MKNTNITLFAAALAAASLSSTASASPDGFYVSGYLKNSTLEHSIERDTGTNTTPSITSLSEETDFGGGISLGYKTHVKDDFFVAAELFYNSENVETRNLNNLLITEVELESTYGINLKAGFDVTDKFSVYGFIGSTRLDFDLHNSYPFAPPMREASEEETEVNYGFGMAYSLGDKLSVFGEFNQISDVDFDPIPEVAVPGKINPNELDLSSWKVGLSYSF